MMAGNYDALNLLYWINNFKFKIMYNNRKIKPYKGKLIELTYLSKNKINKNIITGEITASDRDGILFNVNKSSKKEGIRNLHLDYESIIKIGKPEKAY
jgi:hypothetical protein